MTRTDMLDSGTLLYHRYAPTAAEQLILRTVKRELEDYEQPQAINRTANTLGLSPERVRAVLKTDVDMKEAEHNARRYR